MRSVFLIGFMASGKTTVGSLLAESIGLPFVDLDTEIERAAGRSIPEIFDRDGEQAFRGIESQTLAALVADPKPRVVATGGGTAVQAGALDSMKSAGWVVHLAAPLPEALSRAGDRSSRPLLGAGDSELAALYNERVPTYRRAHMTVATDSRSPEQVAAAVEQALGRLDVFPQRDVADCSAVALAERSYPVIMRRQLLDSMGPLLTAALPGLTRAAIVCDDNVDPLYGDRVERAAQQAGIDCVRVVVPAGEDKKTVDTFAEVCGRLIEGGLDRRSAVLAVGGGVIGDLAGFAASALFRGIPVIQIPTTIVAMTDSAIGGKTGVNSPAGKNLIGAFWQPSAVLIDPDVLTTLPARERRAALGELVKYGLISGEDLLADVEAIAPTIGAESLAIDDRLGDILARCAAVKTAIVGEDEREGGVRAILNLGHTVGHAIEASAGYGVVLHGEAVALGLLAAARVSRQLDPKAQDLEPRIRTVFDAAAVDSDIDSWLRPEVIDHIGVDKKRTGSQIRFVTANAPGQVGIAPVALERLRTCLLG